MSYLTYTTKALVCGSFVQNTADKTFLLFTREAGMLFAVAKSVREERSKQRPALQDFSQIKVSLVKGRGGWRIGSVEVDHNDFLVAPDRPRRGSVTIIYRLLRRFIRGEEAAPDLYDYVVRALLLLQEEVSDRPAVELLVQMRILEKLGYVDKATVPAFLPELPTANWALTATNNQALETLKRIIERALSSSHL